VRHSQASLRAHLPSFNESEGILTLPPHIADQQARIVHLPQEYRHRCKKDRQNILALMACVRLHKRGLLTERLLPLTQDHIRAKLVSLVTTERWDDVEIEEVLPMKSTESEDELFIYRVVHESEGFDRFRQSLQCQYRDLALLTSKPLVDHPMFEQVHRQFGNVKCSFDLIGKTRCSQDELQLLSAFFTTIFNA
jgi:hypothetical protein